MQWWAWVLIWLGLVLALIAMLVLLGVRLFKKAMRAVDALGDLTDSLSRLDAAGDELSDPPFVPSVLREKDEVESDWHERRDARAAIRAARAEARRARGRLLTSADLRRRTFPWESSATRSPGGT